MRIKQSNGFSLIELMVTLSILGIVLGIGLPSLDSLVKSSQLKATSSKLQQSINYARGEAIKRNRSVELRAVNNDWKKGWQVFYIKSNSEQMLRQYDSEPQVSITSDNNALILSFDSNGYLSSATSFELGVGDKTKSNYEGRTLDIFRSGQLAVSKHGKNDGGSNG